MQVMITEPHTLSLPEATRRMRTHLFDVTKALVTASEILSGNAGGFTQSWKRSRGEFSYAIGKPIIGTITVFSDRVEVTYRLSFIHLAFMPLLDRMVRNRVRTLLSD